MKRTMLAAVIGGFMALTASAFTAQAAPVAAVQVGKRPSRAKRWCRRPNGAITIATTAVTTTAPLFGIAGITTIAITPTGTTTGSPAITTKAGTRIGITGGTTTKFKFAL